MATKATSETNKALAKATAPHLHLTHRRQGRSHCRRSEPVSRNAKAGKTANPLAAERGCGRFLDGSRGVPPCPSAGAERASQAQLRSSWWPQILSRNAPTLRVNLATPALFKAFQRPRRWPRTAARVGAACAHHGVLPQQGEVDQGRGGGGEVRVRRKVRRPSERDCCRFRGAAGRARRQMWCWVVVRASRWAWWWTRMCSALSRRLELTKETTPEKVERTLMRVIPQSKWIDFSHEMNLPRAPDLHSRASRAAPTAPWSGCATRPTRRRASH